MTVPRFRTEHGTMGEVAVPAFTGAHREALVDRALSKIEARDNAASLLWLDGAELVLAMNDRQLVRARRVIVLQLDGYTRVKALAAMARASSPGRRERAVHDALAATERWPTAKTGSAPTGRSPRTSSRTISRRR